MPSFDVVSEVNIQEVKNAVDQTRREIDTRYDFKGTPCSVELREKEGHVILEADQKMRLSAMQEILRQKLSKRGVSLKSVTFKDSTPAGGDMIKQIVEVKQSLNDEELKKVTKAVKESKLKVNSQIQGSQVRVTGKQRDDLQQAITYLKGKITDLDLQFTNFRE